MNEINLLPQIEKNRKNYSKQNSALVVITISVIGILFLGYYLLSSYNKIYAEQAKTAESEKVSIQEKINRYKAEQTQLADFSIRLEALSNLNSQRISWTKVITEFSKTVPANVKIASFASTGAPPSFIVAAETVSRENIEIFKKRLEDSAYFQNVDYNSSTESETDQGKKVTFNFTFAWETPKNQ